MIKTTVLFFKWIVLFRDGVYINQSTFCDKMENDCDNIWTLELDQHRQSKYFQDQFDCVELKNENHIAIFSQRFFNLLSSLTTSVLGTLFFFSCFSHVLGTLIFSCFTYAKSFTFPCTEDFDFFVFFPALWTLFYFFMFFPVLGTFIFSCSSLYWGLSFFHVFPCTGNFVYFTCIGDYQWTKRRLPLNVIEKISTFQKILCDWFSVTCKNICLLI